MTERLPTPPPHQPPRPDYNTLFEQLVDDPPEDERVAGAIAYVFYKFAKREWVQDFHERHSRRPNDAELRAYIATWTDSRIDGVRTEAKSSLAGFAAYIIEQEKPKIVEEALRHRSFWREVFAAFVGAFFWTIALLLFAVILKFAHIDLLAILQKLH